MFSARLTKTSAVALTVAEVASDYGFVLNPERDVCFKGTLVKRLTESKIVFKERKKEYL